MQNEEHHAQAGSEFGEGSQQSYGVGSATDSDSDAFAGTDEAMLAEVGFERLEHGNIIAEEQVWISQNGKEG